MSILEMIKEEPIDTIDCLFYDHKSFMEDRKVRWIFRGQKKVKENPNEENKRMFLTTSLEKALVSFGIPVCQAPEIEKGFLRKFKRHSSIYLNPVPAFYDYMEWFALMQHYGAPTRLQDWTYSFFDAVYMAVNNMEDDAEVWAINTNYIEEKAKRIIEQKVILEDILNDATIDDIVKNDACAHVPRLFEKIFMREPKRFVLPMNPHNLNERLIIQQGVFLCQGDVSKSFDDNLSECFDDKSVVKENICRFKINNDKGLKKDVLRHLQRMNMNNATLFPGLSGFSKSLRTLLAFLPDNPGILTGHSDYVMEHLYRVNQCNYKDKIDSND